MQASDLVALVLSGLALTVSIVAGLRQLRLAAHANSLPVLVDLFREHRGVRLAAARSFVYNDLRDFELTRGLSSLPTDKQDLVRELAWYYDNLGALVAHGVVELGPVAGYLGGSVVSMWERLEPLVQAERDLRTSFSDPLRWQAYFENLYLLVQGKDLSSYRTGRKHWKLPN